MIAKRLVLVALIAVAAANQQYCKCVCSGNTVVGKIDKCVMCNSSWCLEKNDKLCEEKEDEEKIVISCFQIESTKEKVIIVLFVLGVIAMEMWILGERGV
ncbi:uncharacterized protein CXQ87_003948 [Candidozyma duobushaemuli]|uniref:Uncharacterized protein n=1 Tax=Candidozyma duobushaemuli TaxID=1231522 RepID=A0A2V1AEV9_9ASCO|nr:uncharacterized protein CXQ87_003948 [[Candida] duobushaemulonis]PVH16084.1 hypothetical protein CXQ87_003948 [[Candida] duobushaemulonis]